HLIGPANWFFPRWLDRITPQVSIEAAELEDEIDAAPGSGEPDDKALAPV
ncbi:MAG: hypothetical protein QOE89_290, partial [Pseudonocardiales bacterium]|nr:hypothetical protein [Pseudonocardiales bacterium]